MAEGAVKETGVAALGGATQGEVTSGDGNPRHNCIFFIVVIFLCFSFTCNILLCN